ncbi:MAG TPA: ABC transporter permease [Ramlibacter sp.]|nr:ABC transporter permease [Ramlibacter sp.]
MQLRLERRPTASRRMRYASPLIAAALTLLTGLVLFAALGKSPLAAFHAFFVAPVSSINGVAELLLKASPLVLIAIGLAVGFRGNVWNIGAEGQLTMGAIAAGGLALLPLAAEGPWVLPAMIVAGALGGMAWAAIPALLRTRFNANEILVSLMLTYVAQLLLSFLVHGPWRDPQGFNFPQSQLLPDAALLPILIEGTRLNASVLLTLAAAAAAWVFLNKSFQGYQMRVTGQAESAAGYAGFSARRTIWIGMLTGGAAAGLAGVGEVSGPLGQLLPTVSPGYGFAAIIVAFVGRLNPVGIVLAGLLMSLLYLGGDAAQISMGLPAATTALFQGALLFFLLGADLFIAYRVRWVRSPHQTAQEVLA